MQPNQQQVMQQTAGVPTSTPPVQAQTQQSKEFNTASLCRIGQETVQDIVSRTQEIFQMLKVIQVKTTKITRSSCICYLAINQSF